ncbi:MAG: hypothetical protein ACYTFQ_30130 [Planctomycetota bacterium]|jgi:hypothetical protein
MPVFKRTQFAIKCDFCGSAIDYFTYERFESAVAYWEKRGWERYKNGAWMCPHHQEVSELELALDTSGGSES